MNIHLKFYGVFRTAAKTNGFDLEVEDDLSTVRSVVCKIASQDRFAGLKHLLFDNESIDPRPNALIMVSGREINTLKGLDTELSDNDELALLPVAHGG